MDIEIGKITSKGQTTIPASLRKDLGLDSGDNILFEKKNDTIIIKKLSNLDSEYFSSIEKSFAKEWNSKEDNEAYNDLW